MGWSLPQRLEWRLRRCLQARDQRQELVSPLPAAIAIGQRIRHLRERVKLSRSAFSTKVLGKTGSSAKPMRGVELGYTLEYKHLQMVADYLEQPLRVVFPDVFPDVFVDGAVADEIVEATAYTIDEQVAEYFLREGVRGILNFLSDRDRAVIVLRFGLDGGKEWTYEEIGKKLSVSTCRAREICLRAIERLRGHARKNNFCLLDWL